MSRALRVEAEALEELQKAAAWYEDKRPGLGVEFVDAIERTVVHVREMPGSFVMIMNQPPVRRALVRKFPYAVVFIAHEDAIHVLAYTHVKRQPLYWAHRIPAEEP